MNVEQRQAIERIVIRHLIRTMKQHGWIISHINDGGESDEDTLNPNETEAMDTVFSVDESTIYFRKQLVERHLAKTHFAMIILGNNGYDCIADHSCGSTHPKDDFEKVMFEVQNWIDNLEDR